MPTFGLFFAPLSMGAKGRMGVNKARGPGSLGGGCLGPLSGASRSRWELTHRVTAAGSNYCRVLEGWRWLLWGWRE